MSDKKLAIKLSTLEAIGEAVRGKEGTTDLIPVNTLADRIAALPSGVNKLPQVADRTVTEITAEDLAGATKIESYAFYACKSLTSVTIPNSVTDIGHWAFQYCDSLTSVTIGSSVTSIGDYAFANCGNLTSVIIPIGVTRIGVRAFYLCSKLTDIIIPNSVTEFGQYAFYDCSSLTSVTIPNSVTRLGNYTFQSCGNLTSVIIENGVTEIGTDVFLGCLKLANITIPDSVTKIGSKALRIGSTTNKATITFLGTTPPTIYSDTFDASRLEKIIVPKGCGEAYKTATNWAKFADYIEEAAE